MPRLKLVIVDAANDAAVYLIDAAGEAWRVWDCVGAEPSRRTAATPPDPLATHRCFISQADGRRVYAFAPKDSHALVPSLLARQISAATPQ